MTAHEDLSVILIQGTFGIPNSRHVLDDHGVVRVFSFLVQDIVGFNHIINDIALADLLASESLMFIQVLAIYKQLLLVTV